jgi:16S rRNA (guanine(966)-N(2))-methyltransferase RsmD
MARITSGKSKNVPLEVPDVTRPMTDRIKTSVFDILTPVIEDAICLDLFAGTGGLGLEAISRGAKDATFVEQDKLACEMLQKNITRAKFEDQSIVIRERVEEFLINCEKIYSIVFLDPPFPLPRKSKLAVLTKSAKACIVGGYIIFRHEETERFPTEINSSKGALKQVLSKKYGISIVDFYEVQ